MPLPKSILGAPFKRNPKRLTLKHIHVSGVDIDDAPSKVNPKERIEEVRRQWKATQRKNLPVYRLVKIPDK